MNKHIILALAISALFAGCASKKLGNVIPLAGGNYQVTGLGSTKEDALKMSLRSARHTCNARKQAYIVTGQQTQYKGVISEDTNQVLNKAADIAAIATQKWIPTLSSGDDYQVTIAFTCEAIA